MFVVCFLVLYQCRYVFVVVLACVLVFYGVIVINTKFTTVCTPVLGTKLFPKKN